MYVIESPPGDSASVRAVTAGFLTEHCPWADTAAVQLVVTELTANALRHTDGWWRLRLRTEGDELWVELDDSSPRLPRTREPDFSGGGGFGWPMVQNLAGRVEVRRHAEGKTVRAVWGRPRVSARFD
ncbi:ATP-binding protein [Streptomyces sp. NPDC006368]|uniref:ATP-binding protein n=1 Tax=Streptomyces sp. NPDC006368 TaxID=3156760 RepID=UPI0033A044AC